MKQFLLRISAKAVAAGAAVDIVATNVALFPVAVVVFARMDLQGRSSEQLTDAFEQALLGDPTLYVIGLLLGCAASAGGGWVAAKIAGRDGVLNGLASSFACVALGIYGLAAGRAAIPVWQHLIFLVLSPALGAAGGAARSRQQARAAARPTFPAEGPATGRQPLRGAGRFIYVVNRSVLAVAMLGLLFFGLVGLSGYSTGQRTVMLGSMVLSGFPAGSMVLLVFAGRMLRAGRRTHWALHAGAAALLLFPFVLMLLAARRG